MKSYRQSTVSLSRLPESFVKWQLESRRVLFSSHIQQPAYPSGYVLWVSEVFDKSPSG